jgi:S1-C subfamily serine protease
MPFTQQYQAVKDSVVQVLALDGQTPVNFGSGSVVGDGRHVLTCAHCIVQGSQMSIADPQQPRRVLFGNPVFVDLQRDIALLEFPQPLGRPVQFANSNSCAIGNGVFVVGFPMGITERVLFGAHIASVTPTHLRVDASVNHGNSGGPLFNLAGAQIGVINAKHGSLSAYLTQLMNAQPRASVSIDGIDPVQSLQILTAEMQKNLNLGIGYAVPTALIKPLHPVLTAAIP